MEQTSFGTCPCCSGVLEGAVSVVPAQPAPVPGDLSVCPFCFMLLAVETSEPYRVRMATADEERALLARPKTLQVQAFLRYWKRADATSN